MVRLRRAFFELRARQTVNLNKYNAGRGALLVNVLTTQGT